MVKLISHDPAQPTPFGATVRIEVSLELYSKVALTLVPASFCAVAVKLIVLPTCSDVLIAGERVTCAGNGDWPAGGWPPHPLMVHIKMIAATNRKLPEHELRMHPLWPSPSLSSKITRDEPSNELENL